MSRRADLLGWIPESRDTFDPLVGKPAEQKRRHHFGPYPPDDASYQDKLDFYILEDEWLVTRIDTTPPGSLQDLYKRKAMCLIDWFRRQPISLPSCIFGEARCKHPDCVSRRGDYRREMQSKETLGDKYIPEICKSLHEKL